MQVHDVESLQRRNGSYEQRGHDGEILRDVVGDGERGQRPACHKQLFADFDNLYQFGRVVVEVHHVARLFGRLRTAVHRNAHIGLCESRSIVRTVAHHGHQFAPALLAPDVFEFVFRFGLGDKIVHPCLFRYILCRKRVVARYHHRFDTHLAQTLETFADTGFDDILQFDDSHDTVVLANDERRTAVFGNPAYGLVDSIRILVACLGHDAPYGFRGSFADTHTVRHVHARTLRFGRKVHHTDSDQLHRVYPDTVVGSEFHNRLSFGRLVGYR